MITDLWFRFTICARYGMDPAGPWFDELDPVVRMMLVEYERVELVRKK